MLTVQKKRQKKTGAHTHTKHLLMHALKQYHKKVRSEMCIPADSQPTSQPVSQPAEQKKNERYRDG